MGLWQHFAFLILSLLLLLLFTIIIIIIIIINIIIIIIIIIIVIILSYQRNTIKTLLFELFDKLIRLELVEDL